MLLVAMKRSPERLRGEAVGAPDAASPDPRFFRQDLAGTGSTAAATAGPTARCGDRDRRDELSPATRAYADRRSEEGLSKKEIIRCLKRYVAREVYRQLRDGA
jgi:hypothetical protein